MENLNSINWNRRERELGNSFSSGRVPNSFAYDFLLRRIYAGEHSGLFHNGPRSFFNKVRLDYTRLGSICITVFGNNLYAECARQVFPPAGYRIFTESKVQDFSLMNLRHIVLSQIGTAA